MSAQDLEERLERIEKRLEATDERLQKYLEKAVEAVFTSSHNCDECPYFMWGGGGEDPSTCDLLTGAPREEFEVAGALEDCHGLAVRP